MNVTNKTKQNRNRRDNNVEEDEYVYPSAKVRETKTRDRRSGKNQIRKDLIDIENQTFDDFDEDTNDPEEWYDDTPMASEDDIEAFYDKVDEQKRIENEEGGFSDAVFEFDDVNTTMDTRWEDY